MCLRPHIVRRPPSTAGSSSLKHVSIFMSYITRPLEFSETRDNIHELYYKAARVLWNTWQYSWAILHNRSSSLKHMSIFMSYITQPLEFSETHVNIHELYYTAARFLWNTCQYSWAILHSRSISLKHMSIFMSYNTRLARELLSTCRYHQAGSSSLKHV